MSASFHVVWTFRATRRFNQALVRRRVHTGQPIDSGAVMADLNRILALAFPTARECVVHDQYLGFRFREAEHILLVEVHDDDRPGHFVVKVKDAAALATELKAWDDCRPAGMRHDLVFMTVDPVRDHEGRLLALLYQDAQQFISVDRTASLEDVFLGSVQHGVPTPESVANVLTELFARVGHLLYQGACPVTPTGQQIALNGGRVLETYFPKWEVAGGPQAARRVAVASLPLGQNMVCDPVDYFRYVADQLQSGRLAEELVPRMMRGPAHGDLHGRNVLVGIVENEAHWPAVFDYEDMGTANLLGWDFAKLETELKIRAYQQVFSAKKLLEFCSLIYHFEIRLCEATERHRRAGDWPAPGGATPEERLFNLLLTIRRLAGKYLGDAHNRPGEWLMEYYFLLGCYGVYAGKFDNLKEAELIGAFLSAGVAAERINY